MSIYDFTFKDILGLKTISLSEFKGKVLVIVNVASKCGLTKKDYPQLAELAERYYEEGLRILCFPCNQFASQEPGTSEQICEFAQGYSDKFIVFEKILVNDTSSKKCHPLYQYLKKECSGFLVDAIKWNFTKFLVNRQGIPVKRFSPYDQPSKMDDSIKELLAEKEK